ncbi:MAG: SAM-dependent methyltransferase [Puniceicoccaceae bacterium]
MGDPSESDVVRQAQDYYNSDDADRFYFNIWGGEDIHIGLYDGDATSILEASHRTVGRMGDAIGAEVGPGARILDIGAGYGGSARALVRRFGCQVTCLNLSEVQNERNRRMNREQGLDDRIEVFDGNFEELPFPDDSFEVVWCQDSILHSGRRERVFQEVDRVLKPGGVFLFTDIMQREPADPERLQPVYDRIHLPSLGSIEAFDGYAASLGWKRDRFDDLSEQLPTHYQSVHDELERRRGRAGGDISDAYIERMLSGLRHWVAAGRDGLLRWGIVRYRKP